MTDENQDLSDAKDKRILGPQSPDEEAVFTYEARIVDLENEIGKRDKRIAGQTARLLEIAEVASKLINKITKRISELEAERDHYAVLYSKECDTYSEVRIKVDELEAKLATAERSLEFIGCDDSLEGKHARATLAELKGQANDK